MKRLLAPARLLLPLLAGWAAPLAAQAPSTAPAVQPGEELVRELWQTLELAGQPMGYSSYQVFRFEEDGEERYRIENFAKFRFGRLGGEVEIAIHMTVVEDGAGQIKRAASQMDMAKNPTRFEGVVADGWLRGTSTLMDRETPVELEWEDGVVSPRGLEELTLLLIGEGEGATASVRAFDPTMMQIYSVDLEVGPATEIEHRGETVPCTLIWGETELMPGVRSSSWVDERGVTLRSNQKIAGGLEIVVIDATREQALAAMDHGEPLHDLFEETVVRSDRRIARPRQVEEGLYRLKLRDPALGLPELASGSRQQVLEQSEEGLLLRVRRVHPPAPLTLPLDLEALPEGARAALEPEEMVQCDDPDIVAAAREAIAGETDAWAAARLLETWVYEHIDEKNMDVAMASASEVYAERTGDCSEHAVLLAAMCRAVGIPARVSIGFEYFSGIFGGHAWTEVWVGDWCALDATLGYGWADATHISFYDGAFGEDEGDGFLGLARVFGNLDIEVLELRYGDRVVDLREGEAAPAVIDGRYTDPLLGFSFAVPEGWDAELSEGGQLGQEAAEFEAPDGPDQVELHLQSVPNSFTLEELAEQILDEDDPEPKAGEVAGCPSIRIEEARGEGRGKTLVFFLSGDTLIGFELRWSSLESRAALERMLKSVELTAEQG